MSSAAQAILDDWSPPIGVNICMLLAVAVYLRGWLLLRRSSPGLLNASRLIAFCSGIFALWIAIGSPLSAFDEASLTIHMIQHILLMFVVPPLVLIGWPVLPLLHGLPQLTVRRILGPFFRFHPVQSLGDFLTHPAVCWLLASVAMVAWHVPAAFNLALRSETWHNIEHACFLSTSLLFWWPVIQPYPSVARWPRWSVPVYLFLGMFPSSALGALLVFYERPLYSGYADAPPLFGLTPFEDQVLAGALMWVVGFAVCAVPAIYFVFQLLSPRHLERPIAAD